MDGPEVSEPERRRALRGLARINRWSGVAERIWQVIERTLQELGLQSFSLLDVAGGGGDVAITLGQLAAKRGVSLDITLLDRDAGGLALASENAERAGVAVRCWAADALAGTWPEGFDVVMCSLFLHHLEEEQAVVLLSRMARSAWRLVLVSDLRRSAVGWAVAWAGCRVLSRSPVVHHDGPTSVRAAWSVEEVESLAQKARLQGARVERCWPWRWMLTWCIEKAGT